MHVAAVRNKVVGHVTACKTAAGVVRNPCGQEWSLVTDVLLALSKWKEKIEDFIFHSVKTHYTWVRNCLRDVFCHVCSLYFLCFIDQRESCPCLLVSFCKWKKPNFLLLLFPVYFQTIKFRRGIFPVVYSIYFKRRAGMRAASFRSPNYTIFSHSYRNDVNMVSCGSATNTPSHDSVFWHLILSRFYKYMRNLMTYIWSTVGCLA